MREIRDRIIMIWGYLWYLIIIIGVWGFNNECLGSFINKGDCHGRVMSPKTLLVYFIFGGNLV